MMMMMMMMPEMQSEMTSEHPIVHVFLQILPTAPFPFSHSGFTICISQTVTVTSEHIRLFTF